MKKNQNNFLKNLFSFIVLGILAFSILPLESLAENRTADVTILPANSRYCDIRDTISEGEQRTYSFEFAEDYDIQLVLATNERARFKINGEITEELGIGESDELMNGAFISVLNIYSSKIKGLFNSAESVVKNVEFCLLAEPFHPGLEEHFDSTKVKHLDMYIYSKPHWLGRNIHWDNEQRSHLTEIDDETVELNFEDWSDFDFDDAVFRVENVGSNEIKVTLTNMSTAAPNPTHIVLDFEGKQKKVYDPNGRVMTGDHFDILLWDDLRDVPIGSSKTIMFNDLPEGQPDLVVEDISFEPNSPDEDDNVRIGVTVRNVGSGVAENFAVGLFKFVGFKPAQTVLDIDEDVYTAEKATNTYQKKLFSLGAGESETLYFGPYKFDSGHHLFMAEADIFNTVEELNETNNKMFRGLYVREGDNNQVIYVELGEKFGLIPEQSAIVTNYNNMRIQLNSIQSFVCAAVVGSKCYPYIANFDASISYDNNAGLGVNFDLKEGESKELFGAVITLLDLSSDKATLIIEKENDSHTDLVEVSIEPKKQTVKAGETASYKVTIKDKHHQIECFKAPCLQPEYKYELSVGNMPLQVDIWKYIYLTAGQKKTLDLEIDTGWLEDSFPKPPKISEENLEDDKEGINSEKAVTNVKPLYIGHDEKTYRFFVSAKLVGDENIKHKGWASLKVISWHKPKPGSTVSISLNKGWNLVSIPGKLKKFMSNQCTDEKKLIAYVWIDGKYVTLQEAREILGHEFAEFIGKNAFWVYSHNSCDLKVRIGDTTRASEIDLSPGWNFLPVTYDMISRKAEEISKGCSINSIYSWDANHQEWDYVSLAHIVSNKDIGKGYIARSSNYCWLSGGLTPPPLPE